MDLTGIGILLIGIALLILAIALAQLLNNITSVLKGIDKTVEQLPEQLDSMLDETGKLLHNSNNTLVDVNEKLSTLTPIFHIVGDVGESTRRLSSSLVNVSKAASNKSAYGEPSEQKKKIGGIYGSTALGYYLFKKRKEQKGNQGWKTYA